MEEHKGTLAVMLLWEEKSTSCRIPKVPWRCFGAFRESPDLVKVHLKGESRFPTLEPEWSEMMLEEVRQCAEALWAHSGSGGIHQPPEPLCQTGLPGLERAALPHTGSASCKCSSRHPHFSPRQVMEG